MDSRIGLIIVVIIALTIEIEGANQARNVSIKLMTIAVIFVGSWAWPDKTRVD